MHNCAAAALWLGLGSAAKAADAPPRDRTSAAAALTAVLGMWLMGFPSSGILGAFPAPDVPELPANHADTAPRTPQSATPTTWQRRVASAAGQVSTTANG
ncbi:hypothetical protein Slala02_27770 [Streptomyces lavendulae subsp. lavendulae]|nr:hypothetical protein Slala01_31060 [Streptomyces lavendulae subsp. lavendulae]GLX26957.1 hypothetical protein Slala02_27770 [Streptomyces lavendulae subsp. lavendulae]